MRAWGWANRYADALLAGLLAAAVVTEIWTSSFGDNRVALTAAALLATLPLAVRRTHPLAMFVLVWAGIGTASHVSHAFDRNAVTPILPFVLSLYSLGANARGRSAWAAAVVVPAAITVFVANDGDSFHVGDVLFATLLVGGPWGAGLALRLRRQSERRLAGEKEAAEAAIVEERARIARELHDVVAHAISVVVLQARGGRRMLDVDVDESRRAFDTIERTGAQALAEMRRLLGLLRSGDEELALAPQPSLSRLDALVDGVRGAGLPVELEVHGEPVELPPGVDLSAYRILQEALTNALKHAGPARARVVVGYGDGELELEVVDDGTGTGGGNGAGHGLTGIRERVSVYGGALEAGPADDGGYAVRARLPYAAGR